MAKIFGYNGPSWLVQASQSSRESDTKALKRLLSPQGRLFMAIHSADCDGTIKFHFPKQRLPTFTQVMLSTVPGMRMARTWPQYEGTFKEEAGSMYGEHTMSKNDGHLHVSVFQYFCYWFAFYAIKGHANAVDAGAVAVGNSGFVGSSMKRAADALHLNRSRSNDKFISAYITLLREFLCEFLPRPVEAWPPHERASSTAVMNPYQVKSSSGLLLYSILLEFWLKDCEEKLPSGDQVSSKAMSRPRWSSSYEPPSEDLLEAIEEMTSYIYTYATSSGQKPAQGVHAWLPVCPVLYGPNELQGHTKSNVLQGPRLLGNFASMASQAYGRQIYRLLYRAFSSWPDQRTIKPLLRLFMCIIAPWQYVAKKSRNTGSSRESAGGLLKKTHVTELAHLVGFDGKQSKQDVAKYTKEWENHVLANLPMYLDLIPLFLKLSISRIGARGEPSVHDVIKIVQVFEQAPALVDLLQDVETSANKCYTSQPRRAEGNHAEIIPWVIDQANDWREFASASKGSGNQTQPRLFSLFSTSGPCAALCGNDIICISASILKPEAQEKLKKCLGSVLPLSSVQNINRHLEPAMVYPHEAENMKLPKNTWQDVKFRGDPLKIPRMTYEVKYLVDFMIYMSEKLNASLGLGRPVETSDAPENVIQEIAQKIRK